ncbi:hypothetical protein O181_100647 [Austropuccinia psidii MF-1]|uniref:Uncharacterized protein n=1 Tax=Austropuccinia psidii MF-1 TaxID=1389203 RepID=A0A9Q3PHQ3_9BASI|nr:hypothetical protein [Austropuccinia psidii MF-1]
MHQPSSVLPTRHSLKIKLQIPASRLHIPEGTCNNSHHDLSEPENLPEPVSTALLTKKSKNYDYVLYYKEAPKNITISISQDNIMVGKRNILHPVQLLLNDAVLYLQAIIDPIEGIKWKKLSQPLQFTSLDLRMAYQATVLKWPIGHIHHKWPILPHHHLMDHLWPFVFWDLHGPSPQSRSHTSNLCPIGYFWSFPSKPGQMAQMAFFGYLGS